MINAVGPEHRDATRADPVQALTAYRRKALSLQNTARLCADQGIMYEPLVFSAQGGVEPKAETILTRLAALVAAEEVCKPPT